MNKSDLKIAKLATTQSIRHIASKIGGKEQGLELDSIDKAELSLSLINPKIVNKSKLRLEQAL